MQNRVSIGNRLCTPGSPGDLQTASYHKFLIIKRLQQIPRIQWVACRTVPVIGAWAVHGRWHTIPVAIRWPIIPIPLHVGDRQAPETYRFRCNQGQKGSVMHRFRGYRGKLDAKKYQVPPRFPRLRGCTRPIVNSWVKFFPWGTGEGGPFWACRLSSKIDMRRVHGRDILLVCFSLVWSAPYLRLVKQNRHAAVPRGGGRIDLEGGYTLRAGSYSGPAVVARSRVGPSIKFGQIYKSVTGYR